MRRLPRVLVCAILAAAFAGGTAPVASAADACSLGDTPVSQLSEFGAQFVTICLINEQRAGAGVAALTYNAKLYLAAEGHAVDMVDGRYFAHAGRDGSSVVERVTAQTYASPDDGTQLGEDLAWGSAARATPRAAVEGWLASPAHRAVMLHPEFREIGIGVRLGAPVTGVVFGESVTYAASFGVVIPARTAVGRARSRARSRLIACRRAAAASRSARRRIIRAAPRRPSA